jgi:hypothetical protein
LQVKRGEQVYQADSAKDPPVIDIEEAGGGGWAVFSGGGYELHRQFY